MKPSEQPSDAQLDRLLGGSPDLGVGEKEAILTEVLARTAAPVPVWKRPLSWLALAGTVAAAVLVVVLTRPPPEDEFTPRGTPLASSFTASCVSGACKPGDKLALSVEPRDRGSLALVAETPDGTTVWVFPRTSEGVSLTVSAGPLSDALVLDGPPGAWVLHAVFTARPLTREEVKSALADPKRFDAQVVKQQVQVDPR